MKRTFLAVLLIFGLLLAGCGDTSTPEPQPEANVPTKTPMEVEASEVGLLAPGEPVVVGNILDGITSLEVRSDSFGWIGHGNGSANLVATDSAEVSNRSADWNFVEGLAGSSNGRCVSIESVNRPGEFLRHSGYRVSLAPNDSSDLFAQDATFCTTFSLDGGTDAGDLAAFSFESLNFPGYFLRAYFGELWIATPGGPLPQDDATTFAAEASWDLYEPISEISGASQ